MTLGLRQLRRRTVLLDRNKKQMSGVSRSKAKKRHRMLGMKMQMLLLSNGKVKPQIKRRLKMSPKRRIFRIMMQVGTNEATSIMTWSSRHED